MLRKKAKTVDKPKFTDPKDIKINETLKIVIDAMKEKGYDPYTQLALFLMTEDEIYITTYNNARKLLLSLNREETIKHIIKFYFDNW